MVFAKSVPEQQLLDAGVRLTPGGASFPLRSVSRPIRRSFAAKCRAALHHQAVSDVKQRCEVCTRKHNEVCFRDGQSRAVMSLRHVAIPALAATRMMVGEADDA